MGTFIIIMFSHHNVYGQEILNEAKSNHKLLRENPELAYQESRNILKKALLHKDNEAELYALNTICLYYEKKYDFKNMLFCADSLNNKARAYNYPAFRVIANNFRFKAYAFSGLEDEAYDQLQEGLKIIKRLKTKDSLAIEAESNLYISFSNYYLLKENHRKRLEYIRLSMIEHEKFNDSNYRKSLQFIDFANLATVYNEINIDSAEYYASLSISKNNNYFVDDVEFSNLVVLGQVNQKREVYDTALSYYLQAEKVVDFKNHINVKALYENIIQLYQVFGDSEKEEIYLHKLSLLNLNVYENQNESLRKILIDKKTQKKKNFKNFILVLCTLLILAVLVVYLFYKNRTKILEEQEQLSQLYLNEKSRHKSKNTDNLINMLKKNDIAFISSFNEDFPEFTKKILAINPEITNTEIEFCALIKLNIPTKDIARYKFLSIRTVQNKKYIIRKKLNIPKDVDIYLWINKL
ncbi:helix-turn-helix transcriptional regulator [Gelidibacter japonicus]|uniref:helix-turn-helix transcriptional regulator n=1 Tax=Gelidibacter japonicus TaxID=1962232 RepID=UPI0013D0EDA2|nr:hypothetical protein [Gelidibacter japonicus]